jgi:hypothetical protein
VSRVQRLLTTRRAWHSLLLASASRRARTTQDGARSAPALAENIGSQVSNRGSSATTCMVPCKGQAALCAPSSFARRSGALQRQSFCSRSSSSRHPPLHVRLCIPCLVRWHSGLTRAAVGRHAIRGREKERTDRAAQVRRRARRRTGLDPHPPSRKLLAARFQTVEAVQPRAWFPVKVEQHSALHHPSLGALQRQSLSSRPSSSRHPPLHVHLRITCLVR